MNYARMFISRPRSLMLLVGLRTLLKQVRDPKVAWVAGALVAITGGASYAAWRQRRAG
jgi:hypothetical protein